MSVLRAEDWFSVRDEDNTFDEVFEAFGEVLNVAEGGNGLINEISYVDDAVVDCGEQKG